jgi:hypothetical protein
VVFIGGSQGKGMFPGCHYLMEDLSPLVLVYGILLIVNGFYQAMLIPWQRHDVI